MKRELLTTSRGIGVCGCCPGHDEFPGETYKNRRSKKARARDIKREHRLVRRYQRNQLLKDLKRYAQELY